MKLYSLDVKNVDYRDTEKNPFLGTINIEPDLYELFQLNNKWYVLGTVNVDKKYGGAHEIQNLNLEATETEYENYITCPICGYVDMDSFEADDEDTEYQCGRCGAILEVSRNVEVTYSAAVKELPTILQNEGEKI